MKALTWPAALFCWSAVCVLAGEYTIFPGDGSEEPGFVPPPRRIKLPPPPPRTVSSAETTIPFPPPPVAPLARTEAKKPPRPPVLFTKIRTGHVLDWAATPNDVNNLLKRMRGMIDVNYGLAIRTLDQINPDPEANPIIYRSGHYHFQFTPEQRARLRQFMLDGGMLVLNTGLGSRPFYESAKRELALIFPEIHLQRLSSDHPLFHSYFDLDRVRYRPAVYRSGFKGDEPWFDGITIDCRVVALVSRWGLAVGWEENENDDYQAYASADAQKLGVNIFAYATAQRAWVKQAVRRMKFVDRDAHDADKLFLGQIIYDGEWKTRHVGLSVLLQTFNLKTEIPVKFGLKDLRLSDPGLFGLPLVYLTGHEHFTLPAAEIAALRRYLLNGGFLFAEACCGRKGFDLAFRENIRRVLPEYRLEDIPEEDSLWQRPNRITRVGLTPALAARVKSATAKPRLQGIRIGEHYAVIYSPFGLAGGWEMSPNPYAFGYDSDGAMLLGQNVLLYSVTQ